MEAQTALIPITLKQPPVSDFWSDAEKSHKSGLLN
jgi:hypothetical protein